jgi:hypothetical protein
MTGPCRIHRPSGARLSERGNGGCRSMVRFQRGCGEIRSVTGNRARPGSSIGRLSTLVGVLAAVAALVSTGPASARNLPTMLACTHTSCSVYQVRPRDIPVDVPPGEEVTLSWSSWRSTKATGAGTWTEYIQGLGTTRGHIRVVAYDIKHGHFTVLRITFTGSHPHTLVLVPRAENGSPAWVLVAASSVPPAPGKA